MNKILTFYSESHRELFENYFLKSYNKFLSGNYNLIVKKIDQISETGEFASKGFDLTMLEKIKFIIENIDFFDENFLIFADCDIQFFCNLEYDLGYNDIIFQEDASTYCAGFFICRQNKKVKDFFECVKNKLLNDLNGVIDDQGIINQIIDKFDISVGKLPKDKFWTVGNSTNGLRWVGQDFYCPPTVQMHHANFTVGIDNKKLLMNMVREKLNEK
jgi:hypothetical protein